MALGTRALLVDAITHWLNLQAVIARRIRVARAIWIITAYPYVKNVIADRNRLHEVVWRSHLPVDVRPVSKVSRYEVLIYPYDKR